MGIQQVHLLGLRCGWGDITDNPTGIVQGFLKSKQGSLDQVLTPTHWLTLHTFGSGKQERCGTVP